MHQLVSHHCFRYWLVAWAALSHYPNQCWNTVNWIPGNKLQWNLIWNKCIFYSRKCISKWWPICLCLKVLILNVWGPSYLGLVRSISWLLMPWLLVKWVNPGLIRGRILTIYGMSMWRNFGLDWHCPSISFLISKPILHQSETFLFASFLLYILEWDHRFQVIPHMLLVWGDLQVESFEWSHCSINISTQYFDNENAMEP